MASSLSPASAPRPPTQPARPEIPRDDSSESRLVLQIFGDLAVILYNGVAIGFVEGGLIPFRIWNFIKNTFASGKTIEKANSVGIEKIKRK